MNGMPLPALLTSHYVQKLTNHYTGDWFLIQCTKKRESEITIISLSRSICRRGLAALIGVTGKPYPSCLSCHSHPIRPCGAPSPRGEGCDTRIPSSKKRRRSRHLNPEPNEGKVKRGCEEMRIHFFTAPFDFPINAYAFSYTTKCRRR